MTKDTIKYVVVYKVSQRVAIASLYSNELKIPVLYDTFREAINAIKLSDVSTEGLLRPSVVHGGELQLILDMIENERIASKGIRFLHFKGIRWTRGHRANRDILEQANFRPVYP